MQKRLLFLSFITIGITSLLKAENINDSLMFCLDEEMQHIDSVLKKQEVPAYFVDFRVNELKSWVVQYSSGYLQNENEGFQRNFFTTVRVGDYAFDNTSSEDQEQIVSKENSGVQGSIPVENNPLAISQAVRSFTDVAYKQAMMNFKALDTTDKAKRKSDAFSREPIVEYSDQIPGELLSPSERNAWSVRLKKMAKLIAADTAIIQSRVIMLALNERIYYLNNEGTRVAQNRPRMQIQVIGAVRNQGKSLSPLFKSWYAIAPADLPSDSTLMLECRELISNLHGLKEAPVADGYAGPVILSPEVSGVFFHEIFGHRIEGQRLDNQFDGQTFKDKVGKKVLNSSLNVTFDPGQPVFQGTPLFGTYRYDDEGVKGQRVEVIKDGVLKDFLMSRTPVEGHPVSNGHGRCQTGVAPFSRQSNMFVSSSKPLSEEKLRKMLLKECKKQKKTYGYYIKDAYGGFTTTMSISPQVFSILPTLVYRIYVDGRPDEIVRNVTFIGTPLSAFSEIIAAGDQYSVFNGFCGAESGSVPVSTIAPALLIKKIETQKQPEKTFEMPILASPERDSGNGMQNPKKSLMR